MIQLPTNPCKVRLVWKSERYGIQEEEVMYVSNDFTIGHIPQELADEYQIPTSYLIPSDGYIIFEDKMGIFGVPHSDIEAITILE